MRESDEAVDTSSDGGIDGAPEGSFERGVGEPTPNLADVFDDGPSDPAIVEASVDALFDQFDEDSPEEVMIADRRASESDFQLDPPAFDEFTDEFANKGVQDPTPELSPSVAPEQGTSARRDRAAPSTRADDVGEAAETKRVEVPDPADVVGFEDAPDPKDAPGSSSCGRDGSRDPLARTETDDRSSRVQGADTGGGGEELVSVQDGVFEWVSEPATQETVLSDPERVSEFASQRTGAGDDRSDGESSVLDRVRSSLPF